MRRRYFEDIYKYIFLLNKKLNTIIDMDSLILVILNDLTNGKYANDAKDTLENVKQAIDNNYGND